MFKALLSLVLGFSLVLSGCVLPQKQNDFSAPRAAVHKIVLLDKNGGGSLCSGTSISPDLILTAKHCLLPDVSDTAEINDVPQRIEIVKVSENHDLLLIRVPGANYPFLGLSKENPKLDTPIIVVGTPQPYNYEMVTEGIITAYTEDKAVTTAHAMPGNSGGAVLEYNGRSWVLAGVMVDIGVNCMGFFGGCSLVPYISRGVNTETIKEFLSVYRLGNS